MDPRFTRQEMPFLLPVISGHRNEAEAVRLAVIEAQDRAIGQVVKTSMRSIWMLLKNMVQLPQRRRVFLELNALTDRELTDIGLTRTDIPRVFDRDFAAEFSAARRVPVRVVSPANCNATGHSKAAA